MPPSFQTEPRAAALEEKNADYLIGNQRFVKVIPLRFDF